MTLRCRIDHAAPEANRLHHPLALAYRGLGDRAKAEEHLGKAGAVGLRPADPLLDEVAALRLGERVAIVKGKVAAQAADSYVKDNSWTSVGLGAALGVVLGLLIVRK